MLGLFTTSRPAPLQVELPPWLDDVDLLVVDFECLVSRFPVRELAMRQELRDHFQRTYWRRLGFDPIGAGIRLVRDTLGWRAYRDAMQIVERWELRSLVNAAPDHLVWRTLHDFWLDDGLIAVVGDYTQRAMHRTIEWFETDFLIDMIVGADDVPRPKPDPTMLLAISRATDLPAERTLYIGRGRGDLSMAQRAGVLFRDYRRTFGRLSPELRPDQRLLRQLIAV